MPAYVAGLVTEQDANGNTVYKTIKVKNASGEDVEYYVLSRSNLPTGKQFPAGTIEWNTDEFTYDWQGSTSWNTDSASNSVKVGFTYQWGLGKAVKGSIELSAKNYKISHLTQMMKADASGEADTASAEKFTNARDNNGNYSTVLNLDAMSINANTWKLAEYIKQFKFINSKNVAGKNMNGYDVEWDLTELEKALDAIARKNDNGDIVGYDYYKGVDVTVKAKVGGNRFSISTTVTKKTIGDETSGFVGQKTTYTGGLAQEVNVRIVVNPFVYDSMSKTITFDQYSYDKITVASLGNNFVLNVKDASGNKVEKTLTVGNGLRVEAPFIKAGETYYDAYDNGVHNLTSDEITYEGYTNQRTYPLYAKLTIGTDYSGTQEIYVPIEVNALKPTTLALNVEHEDTLNPTWYENERYQSFSVSFGTATHTMFPDWSTVKYYTNAACTKLKAEQNIFDGGTIYAQVEAYTTLDGTKDGTKLALVNSGKVDEDGNAIYTAQTITLKLSVEKQTVKSVNFFYNEAIGDVAAYVRANADDQAKLDILKEALANVSNYEGTVYQQTHAIDEVAYGIDPINFAQNPSDYFKTSKWGDALGGTPVLVTLDKEGEQPYIAYVQSFDGIVSSAGIEGVEKTAYLTIGGQKVSFRINMPDYTFTSGNFNDGESKLNVTGGKIAGVGEETIQLSYNVFDEWKLPSTAKVTTGEGKGETEVEVKWIDYSAPNKDELNGRDYVERKYFFFDGLSIRYPSADAFTARIYVTGFNAAVDVKPDGMCNADGTLKAYDAFDKFTFATTATVEIGETTHYNVPLHWLDTSMPTAEEIKNGSFTRKAYVTGQSTNGETVVKDFTFTINNEFTLDSITGDSKNGFSVDIDADHFYGGLIKSTTLNVTDKKIPVTLAWSDDYTAAGFDGNMTLTISSDALTSDVTIQVKVASAGIEGLVGGKDYTLDPYGVNSTLFPSGSTQRVKVKSASADKTVQDQLVTVEYDFGGEDFYANISQYFGKKYTVGVRYRYNAGKN